MCMCIVQLITYRSLISIAEKQDAKVSTRYLEASEKLKHPVEGSRDYFSHVLARCLLLLDVLIVLYTAYASPRSIKHECFMRTNDVSR